MAIDVPAYNNHFTQTTQSSGQCYNDATNYGVQIKAAANLGSAQQYWRIVGVHHLTGEENRGNHHVYCDVLDENGQRINNSRVVLWQEGANPLYAVVDKPVNEAGTNLPMWSNTKGSLEVAWPADNPLPSEQAGILRSDHADEPPGNTWGHHSFYVVFQRTAVPAQPTPTAAPTPEVTTQPTVATAVEPTTTPTAPAPASASVEEAIAAAGQPLIIPLNPDAGFYKIAQQQSLGERLTSEYDTEYQGRSYRAQIYERGIVYAEIGDWGNIKVIPRTN